MKHYLCEKESVLEELSSGRNGLSEEEARVRLEKNGKNKLIEGKKKSLFRRLIDQIADPMVLVLIGAAVVSFITALIEKESPTDVFIILAVVVLNTVLGVVQESKAEKAIDALKEMAAATSKIIRDGKHMVIRSEDLVTGDIVLLEEVVFLARGGNGLNSVFIREGRVVIVLPEHALLFLGEIGNFVFHTAVLRAAQR